MFFTIGYKQEIVKPSYYKNLYTGEILIKTEYENFHLISAIKYRDTSKSFKIEFLRTNTVCLEQKQS